MELAILKGRNERWARWARVEDMELAILMDTAGRGTYGTRVLMDSAGHAWKIWHSRLIRVWRGTRGRYGTRVSAGARAAAPAFCWTRQARVEDKAPGGDQNIANAMVQSPRVADVARACM